MVLPTRKVPSQAQRHIHNIPSQGIGSISSSVKFCHQKQVEVLLTSKLLFLAVESCNAFTQISATSAQLIPCMYHYEGKVNWKHCNTLMSTVRLLPEIYGFLGQI